MRRASMVRREYAVKGMRIPVFELNTVIVGSGAAALKCADRLSAYGVQRIAIVTERLGGGTSVNSGSDKQTYYKLGTGSPAPDSPYGMAAEMYGGGSMHGDIALVESLLSLEAFYGLVSIGVPFPKNRYGGYVGYRTDHDPKQRATSAGPWTSMQMCRSLLAEVERRNVPIFDRHMAVSLLVCENRALGVLALDLDVYDELLGRHAGTVGSRVYGFDCSPALVLFRAENTVFATGGPGGLYRMSVYPENQSGAIGLALERGAAASNLTESQFGLASLAFRWNVSGTYQQVIPRYISTDISGGDEREFLNGFFPSMETLAGAVFLKGYQWPFDPRKIRDSGSSLIDLLVHRETALLGRRVYLDFRRNPEGDGRIGGFDLASLPSEARTYLDKSGALFGIPFERLRKMNPQAVELYRAHGIDLGTEPLEIGVCAQHNNGGLAADIWWESVNIAHLFPIGEVNGSHGVYRPGGAALNAGQVGALRAAEKIANAYAGITVVEEAFLEAASGAVGEILSFADAVFDESGDDAYAVRALGVLRDRMMENGAYLRNLGDARNAESEALAQWAGFPSSRLKSPGLLPSLLTTRHLLVAHAAYLSAVRFYLEHGGGSRGSYLVTGDEGIQVHPALPWAGIPENGELGNYVLMTRRSRAGRTGFEHEFVPRREIPREEFWFETVWEEYLGKTIYTDDH